jgi:hypothetical protein
MTPVERTCFGRNQFRESDGPPPCNIGNPNVTAPASAGSCVQPAGHDGVAAQWESLRPDRWQQSCAFLQHREAQFEGISHARP